MVINESGKIPRKKVVVSPRKYEVIKSFKKPLKLTQQNYVETNTSSSIRTGVNKIPSPKAIKKTEITKTNTGEKKVLKLLKLKVQELEMKEMEIKSPLPQPLQPLKLKQDQEGINQKQI